MCMIRDVLSTNKMGLRMNQGLDIDGPKTVIGTVAHTSWFESQKLALRSNAKELELFDREGTDG